MEVHEYRRPYDLRVLFRANPKTVEVPLVFDSPHSGTDYPEDFDYVCPRRVLRTAEDTFVHELYVAAPAHVATLIGALFPRSYIDANRRFFTGSGPILG